MSLGMPSGHTSFSTWAAFHMAFYITENFNFPVCYQIFIWIASLGFSFLIAFSRIVIAKHTYNQVIVGFATGFFVWTLEAYFAKWFDEGYFPTIINKLENWKKDTKWTTNVLFIGLCLGMGKCYITQFLVERTFKGNNCDLEELNDNFPDKAIRIQIAYLLILFMVFVITQISIIYTYNADYFTTIQPKTKLIYKLFVYFLIF